jgi:uracil-DNA glycosylase family 4
MARSDTTSPQDLESIQRSLVECRRCPRLVAWREQVAREKRAAFRDEVYWARPVPAFGDPRARILVVGLAPAAHGANRTGRMFTGDRSGDWLYRALHKQGFATQPTSTHRDDGLRLVDVLVSASVRCAPPDNRPTPAERAACRPWLEAEMRVLDRVRVIVTLGQIGFDTVWKILASWDAAPARRVRFAHLVEVPLPDGRTLLGSYHPSQQNTFTGKLTEPMFDRVWERARELITLE